MEPSLMQGALLALAGFVAGTVDAIAGGGGRVTVPSLGLTGLDTRLVLGTNKAQSVFGTAAALLRFARAGRIDMGRAPLAFVLGFVGSVLGAFAMLSTPLRVLQISVLVMLVLVALLMGTGVLSPKSVAADGEAPPLSVGRRRAAALLALLVGAYDGFFGPGTGVFLIAGLTAITHVPLLRASAEAKVVNAASNLGALLVLSMRGQVVWAFAVPMLAAQIAGGWVGAHVALRVGDRIVRPLVVVACLGAVARLSWSLWHG